MRSPFVFWCRWGRGSGVREVPYEVRTSQAVRFEAHIEGKVGILMILQVPSVEDQVVGSRNYRTRWTS